MARTWPLPSAPEAYHHRRQRLAARLETPALLVAGTSRARNFLANRYPFRADSHFLYLVGRPLEGAALLFESGRVVLYAEPADPEEALWTGREPTLDELERDLGLEVRPVDELEPPEGTATLPSQDPLTAAWQSELLDRDVTPSGGDELEGADASLADALIATRLVHDESAVDQIRQAVEVSVAAHLAGMHAARAGARASTVRAAMESVVFAHGMEMAYAPIITPRGEALHAAGYGSVLKDGDLVLADVGAETPEGWAADLTRTWPVSGTFSASQRALLEVVRASQQAALNRMGAGVEFSDVHRSACEAMAEGLREVGLLVGRRDEIVDSNVVSLFFPHGIGHLLGLDVHDLEDLGDRAGYLPERRRSESGNTRYLRLHRPLAAGMVVTVEPGFYVIPALLQDPKELEGRRHLISWQRLEELTDVHGIRVEDDVLVTKDGIEVLSRELPSAAADLERVLATR